MKIGTKENPWKISPPDWLDNGVPWADYCECSNCGRVSRSTMVFDYYADGPGIPLTCEYCQMGAIAGKHILADRIAEQIIAEDN